MNSYPKNRKFDEDFIQFSTRVISWKIRNFGTLPEATNYSLDSPSFVLKNATWCLRLYPNADEGSSIKFTLVRLCSRVPHHRLSYRITWDEDGDFAEHFLAVDFDEDHEENGSEKIFIDRSTAFDRRYDLQKTGMFELTCEVASHGFPGLDAPSQTEIFTPDEAVGLLRQNYKNLLLNGEDYDVVLKVKNREFRAHQIILRARSPVLESMLSHDMMEKTIGVVDIPDCDPNAFKQFLIYLYCAEMEILDADNMLSLYYIANKYDVGHLKEECSAFIKESLSSSNISHVIQLATDYSDVELLRCATDYFVEHVKAILPTVQWQSFIQRNGIQANELITKAVNKMSGGNS